MKLKTHTLVIILITVLVSCSEEPMDYPTQVESAHEKEMFMNNDVIQFDLLLRFGGKERINGTLTLSTNSQYGILDQGENQKIIYDGAQVFYSPEISDSSKVRFNAYTWSYFFLFPYKLNDDGTVWNSYENENLNGTKYLTDKLTFESGTGDAPDDWYICYANTENKLLHAAAYIVTYSKDQATAEEDPHAIVYENYQDVQGVPFAHKWTFWGWNATDGLTDQLGEGTLSNIKFLTFDEIDFTVPEDFIEI